jgi:hypothetical protein
VTVEEAKATLAVLGKDRERLMRHVAELDAGHFDGRPITEWASERLRPDYAPQLTVIIGIVAKAYRESFGDPARYASSLIATKDAEATAVILRAYLYVLFAAATVESPGSDAAASATGS